MLLLLAALAAAPLREVPAASLTPAFGSEDPGAQGGTWVPPELRSLSQRLATTPGRPTRVTWIGGSAADGCDEVWRFRLLYGSMDRFADVSAFRSAAAAAACARSFRSTFGGDPSRWALLRDRQHQSGAAFVVVTGNLVDPQRGALLRALDDLRLAAATPVPPGELPAGANPGLYQRNRRRPPPPLHPRQNHDPSER